MPDVVVSVENLSKRYLIGHQSAREQYTALRDVIGREWRNFVRKAVDLVSGREIVQGDEVEELWALKDVSFEVRRGDIVGIIGRNGAGKSTLLKVLSRIAEPTSGRVCLRGRVASLLEVGTGFHPELTGRENIFLNGAILGMSQKEISRKLDGIVSFAEIEKFLDTPVKRYSSGMYVRLAFSVAAHLESDILIVDEVLAVGDASFQKKSLGRMSDLVRRGERTILFVSHQLAAIQNLCPSCIGLREGKIFASGITSSVIAEYMSMRQLAVNTELTTIGPREGDGETRFSRIMILNEQGEVVNSVGTGDFVRIQLTMKGGRVGPARSSRIGINFSTNLGACLFVCGTEMAYRGPFCLGVDDTIYCDIPRLPLSGGRYQLGLFLEQGGRIKDWIPDGIELVVEDKDFYGSGRNVPRGYEGQIVLLEHRWGHVEPSPDFGGRKRTRAAVIDQPVKENISDRSFRT